MARTAINPVVLSTTSQDGLPLVKYDAVDSKTWKKGEFCFTTSGEVEPLSTTGKTSIFGIFAQTQSTSTSSSSVWVYRLEQGTRLACFLMNTGVAAAWSAAYLNVKYGAEGLSNVSYIDVNTTSGEFLMIRKASDLWPYQDGVVDIDAAPALVEVEYQVVN